VHVMKYCIGGTAYIHPTFCILTTYAFGRRALYLAVIANDLVEWVSVVKPWVCVGHSM
jgi:hypothetical protein